MKRITNKLVAFFFVLGLCLVSTIAFADPDPWDDNNVDTPIDGGLSLLIAGGMAYGVHKIKKHRKSSKNDDSK